MLTWQRLACRDPTTPITIYHIGNPGEKEHWWDLCAGPHVESTGDLVSEAIELERTAGAYWRGDESRQMLTRVYGTAWQSELQLEAYRFRQEEAKKRDHRKLGQQLSLFTIEVQPSPLLNAHSAARFRVQLFQVLQFHPVHVLWGGKIPVCELPRLHSHCLCCMQESAGGGLVFWLPKGAMVRNILETFWKDTHLERGYDLMYTPHIAKVDLWKTSGHFEHYGENMFDQMQVRRH